MSLEESKSLDTAIDKRYPELKDTQRSIRLSAKNPWQGIISFYYSNGSTDTAVFRFTINDQQGGPRLYIERDWLD
ncbi:hypothetical protein BLL42_01700 [Pseudomonas frederiksbergensis]|uniref:Uncharacterized protein n=1 Tax=Pseudomonas frederiksbergensis TaxID=104087 RepID=A0A1J0EEN5_9PSED|nr:hypothetical protein [Pseudomonas frederiksbergensis]APC14510.1 hypothetical protein BLL42_01700 [Pseudomonas frederiksbergensis]